MTEVSREIRAIQERYGLFAGRLNERQLREFATVEAKVYGCGGVATVARATGLAVHTIRRGMADLAEAAWAEPSSRVRKAGGGRKKLREKDPGLVEDLEKLVEPFSRGDPRRPLRWTCKSVRRLAGELLSQGHAISPAKVAELLAESGYRLQSHRKRDEGKSHEDRDAQFHHINERVLAFQQDRQPVISVDTKKKELVGSYRNAGREWHPQGQPEESVELIAATSTAKGLKVNAERDSSRYQTAVKPTPEQMASIRLIRADLHGDWNYTLQP